MKPLPLILAFTPLILFSLLTKILPSHDVGISALVAAVVAGIALVATKPIWPPKILNACSLVLFVILAIVGFSSGHGTDKWVASWAASGVGIVMGLVVLALLPVMPFTEQFARESVPREQWTSPVFKKINRVLSSGWGLALIGLGVSRTIATAINRSGSHSAAQIILGAVVPVAILIYMFKFSKSYPEKVTRVQAPAAAPVGGGAHERHG
jgi:hypothetical protein